MPTENLNYNLPDPGESDWHIPLNENFKKLDADVQAALDGSGGDGGGGGNGNGDGDGVTETEALLRQGLIVGVSTRNRRVAVPSESNSDDEAIQTVADRMMGNDEHGFVYIPALNDLGQRTTIEQTVHFDRSNGVDVLPRGYGFNGQGSPYLATTINNGDPMFRIERVRCQRTPFGWLKASAPGQDAEFIRLTNVTSPALMTCEARGFGTPNPSAEGAYVLDSETVNGIVWNCIYNQRGAGGENPTVSGMNAIAARNSLGGDRNGPGEMRVIAFTTYAAPSNPFNNSFDCRTNASNITFTSGRFEGAGGDAHFFANQGEFSIGSPFELGRTENGADGIHFRGFQFTMSDGVFNSGTIEGDGVYMGSGRGYIGTPYFNCDGHDVNIDFNPGRPITVPSPDSLLGTARYPNNAGNVHVIQTQNP